MTDDKKSAYIFTVMNFKTDAPEIVRRVYCPEKDFEIHLSSFIECNPVIKTKNGSFECNENTIVVYKAMNLVCDERYTCKNNTCRQYDNAIKGNCKITTLEELSSAHYNCDWYYNGERLGI